MPVECGGESGRAVGGQDGDHDLLLDVTVEGVDLVGEEVERAEGPLPVAERVGERAPHTGRVDGGGAVPRPALVGAQVVSDHDLGRADRVEARPLVGSGLDAVEDASHVVVARSAHQGSAPHVADRGVLGALDHLDSGDDKGLHRLRHVVDVQQPLGEVGEVPSEGSVLHGEILPWNATTEGGPGAQALAARTRCRAHPVT